MKRKRMGLAINFDASISGAVSLESQMDYGKTNHEFFPLRLCGLAPLRDHFPCTNVAVANSYHVNLNY